MTNRIDASTIAGVKRILVVDDDSQMAALMAKALLGYEVLVAPSSEDALALVAPGVGLDLVITDYLMPSMTGDELLGRLRAQRPHLRALMVTGHADVLDQERPPWWARQPHLSKPFTLLALRESVLSLIGPPSLP